MSTLSDEILSPKEVSTMLKVSKPWPYVMAARGLLPCIKMGTTQNKKLIRFLRSDIERFIEASRVQTRPALARKKGQGGK